MLRRFDGVCTTENCRVIDRYRWTGGEEFVLRFGVNHKLQIIVIQPFFEEANRMRQIIVAAMRMLDAQGIGCSLPDLPGTGESIRALADLKLSDWRDALGAYADSVGGFKITAAFRGGALIDDSAGAKAAWRCAPETGQRLVRDLMRARLTSEADAEQTDDALVLAGNHVSQSLIDSLGDAAPASLPLLRTVRLQTDRADADCKIAGSPMWRRSEPGNDEALLAAIIDDLGRWAKQCAAS
jgi:hypothetical protein